MLQTLPNGKRLVIVGTGDGYVVALDPDKGGSLVWKTKVTNNTESGLMWGGASDGTNIYYGVAGGGGGIVGVRFDHR